MRYDPIITFPENCKFKIEELSLMNFCREHVYFLGGMWSDFSELQARDIIMPLFSEENQILKGKYLNIGNGEIYDTAAMVIQDDLLNNNPYRNYDIYVMENTKIPLSQILDKNTPYTYQEIELQLNLGENKEHQITGGRNIRRYPMMANHFMNLEFLMEDCNEEGVLTRDTIIDTLAEDVLALKRIEENEHFAIKKLWIASHRPSNTYQIDRGYQFITRISNQQWMSIVDECVYETNELEEIMKYTKFLKEHNLEDFYPIYDRKRCLEKQIQFTKQYK